MLWLCPALLASGDPLRASQGAGYGSCSCDVAGQPERFADVPHWSICSKVLGFNFWPGAHLLEPISATAATLPLFAQHRLNLRTTIIVQQETDPAARMPDWRLQWPELRGLFLAVAACAAFVLTVMVGTFTFHHVKLLRQTQAAKKRLQSLQGKLVHH